MGDAKITRRQVIGAAAVGAVLAVTGKDKDEEKKSPQQEAPRSGDSSTEQPKR